MKSKLYANFKKWLQKPVCFVLRIHCHNSENEPDESEGPYVVIANHIANIDPISICAVIDKQQPHFMAKKELFKVPLLNKLVAALGAYPVDRKKADVGAIKKTIKMLEEGKCIGMFPQGHRMKGVDPRETEVKSGVGMIVTRAKVTVLPCFIKTKKRRFTPFCRIDVYVGKPIKFEELNYDPDAPGESVRISRYLFDKVCELGESVNG